MLKTSITITATNTTGLINVLTLELCSVSYELAIENKPFTKQDLTQMERYNELTKAIALKLEDTIRIYFNKIEDDILPF